MALIWNNLEQFEIIWIAMNSYLKTLAIIFVVHILFCFSSPALAADTGLTPPRLQVNIPTLDLTKWTANNSGNWLGLYIKAIYQYALGIVGILAAVVLMFGGLLWLTAGGNTGQVTEAKEWIKASLTGLILALSSYMILYVVNPDLTTFQSLSIEKIKNTAPASSNPITASTINNDAARAGLNSDISINQSASLQGVQQSTIDGINEFQRRFTGPLTITSGTEGQHSTQNEMNHATGYKLDVARSNGLDNFIRRQPTSGQVSGYNSYTINYSDYQYRILDENDHWDFLITRP